MSVVAFDGHGLSAKPASLDEALAGLAAMEPEDTAVVFLAGHGVKPTPEADMVFLASTVSATPEGLRQGATGWTQTGERLAAAKGRVLVLLAACHSDDVSQGRIVPSGELAASLVQERRAGTLLFAAAKVGNSATRAARASPAASHSPGDQTSRHRLLEGGPRLLYRSPAQRPRGPAADPNTDGIIQASELVGEVTARVMRASDSLQTPWVARRELFGDFRLARIPTTSAP